MFGYKVRFILFAMPWDINIFESQRLCDKPLQGERTTYFSYSPLPPIIPNNSCTALMLTSVLNNIYCANDAEEILEHVIGN